MAPPTLLARWPSSNPQSAIPLLARSLSVSRGATQQGRRAVQIRTLRLPAHEQQGQQGRNLFMVRTLDGATERVDVLVQDPAAPPRSSFSTKGKGKATQQDDDDDLMIMNDAQEQKQESSDGHSRWTFASIGALPSLPSATNNGHLFDTFIQRALFLPPPPGAPPGQLGGGFWQPRAAAVSIEGFVFSVGDWEVKIGSVLIKGGTASGTTKGCLVEATYLPVPYLPSTSTFVRDFLLSLFPAAAVQNGEIELVDVGEEDLFEAGMLDRPDPAKGGNEGEWEWREKHSTYAYVHQFKKEGLL
ncbi:hypothetical protein JCM10207_005024 [Rhodosporidiobolus poonsookiae]